MIRGKSDINVDAIKASIKVLTNTEKNKKPFKLGFIDKLLAAIVYGIVAVCVVATILIIL